ncbi:MAG: hypothetical protein NTX65_01250 [Ignavibacteriales bacterium]|nr:hypothetical protein [Ignavibacteriales bacterium]
MEKKNKNIVIKIVHRINSNMALSIPVYSLYYFIVFYFLVNDSKWSWIYVTRSLALGIVSGLFFRFVIYEGRYDRKKNVKIALLIMIGVVIIAAVVEVIIKRITQN